MRRTKDPCTRSLQRSPPIGAHPPGSPQLNAGLQTHVPHGGNVSAPQGRQAPSASFQGITAWTNDCGGCCDCDGPCLQSHKWPRPWWPLPRSSITEASPGMFRVLALWMNTAASIQSSPRNLASARRPWSDISPVRQLIILPLRTISSSVGGGAMLVCERLRLCAGYRS